MKIKIGFAVFIILIFTSSCKAKYSMENLNIGEAKSFQVNLFENNAHIIEPGLHQNFTQTLQEIIQNKTGLELVNSNGDLFYDGEITEYRISPTTATAQNTAAQNRLTISVKVHFLNKEKENTEFDKSFSFFYDYSGNQELLGDLKETAHKEIFNRLTQDILLASLDDW